MTGCLFMMKTREKDMDHDSPLYFPFVLSKEEVSQILEYFLCLYVCYVDPILHFASPPALSKKTV